MKRKISNNDPLEMQLRFHYHNHLQSQPQKILNLKSTGGKCVYKTDIILNQTEMKWRDWMQWVRFNPIVYISLCCFTAFYPLLKFPHCTHLIITSDEAHSPLQQQWERENGKLKVPEKTYSVTQQKCRFEWAVRLINFGPFSKVSTSRSKDKKDGKVEKKV